MRHTFGAAFAAAAAGAAFFFLGAASLTVAGSLYDALILISFPSLTPSRSALFSAYLLTSIAYVVVMYLVTAGRLLPERSFSALTASAVMTE